MSYPALLLATLLNTFILGGMQYYLLELLVKAHSGDARYWIIQLAAALVTIGPAVAFPYSGPLAASSRKHRVMPGATLAVAAVLFAGYFIHMPVFHWACLVVVGLLIGVFNASKMAAVPLAAQQTGRSTAAINAGMSVVLFIGLLTGIPAGTWMALHIHRWGYIVLACIALVSAGVSMHARFAVETLVPFTECQRTFLTETRSLVARYAAWLFSGPLMWGVAAASNSALMAYVVERGLADQQAASFIPLWAAIGVIGGTAVSPLLDRMRYRVSFVSTAVMVAAMPFMPYFAVSYAVIIPAIMVLGLLFGLVTNLVDSSFLEHVGREKREGMGAALQSALVAVSTVVVSGSVGISLLAHWVTPRTQFIVIAAISSVAMALCLVLVITEGEWVGPVRATVVFLGRQALSLRYRVRFAGLDAIPVRKGALLLPNHPAEIDPLIIAMFCWRRFKQRAILLEEFYHPSYAHWLLKLGRSIPIPDLEKERTPAAAKRLRERLEDVVNALATGDNVLLYPSGRLSRTGHESIGNSSGLHMVLSRLPDTPVILMRTRGLWGSSFSCAGGAKPDLKTGILGGMKALLKRGLFFCPRRAVTIECELAPDDFPRNADRQTLNRWLEDWYNRHGAEEVTRVPY